MTFFLTSAPYTELWEVRECEPLKFINFPTIHRIGGILPAVWTKISPPIDGFYRGFEDSSVNTILIVGEVGAKEFYSFKKFPMYVHVYFPNKEVKALSEVDLNHNMIGFDEAELYGTRIDAEKAVLKYRDLNGRRNER